MEELPQVPVDAGEGGVAVAVGCALEPEFDAGAVTGAGVTFTGVGVGAGVEIGAGVGIVVGTTGGSAVIFKVNVVLCERLPDAAFTVMG